MTRKPRAKTDPIEQEIERLVAGSGPSDEPSFLEQAKARWNERQGKTK